MKEELERILDELTFQVIKWKYGASSAETKAEQHKALTSIINLVDKEVIGEDEDSGVTSLHSVALKINYKNELRAEQRAKLKGDK